MNLRERLLLITLLNVCALLGLSHAAVLYNHTFDGAATTLDGSSVDTAVSGTVLGANHGTNSTTWALASTLNTNFLANGTTVDGADATASLAFTPQNGFVYTLSMTGTNPESGGDWIATGFWDGTGNQPLQQGVVWALNRPARSSAEQVAWLNNQATNVGNSDALANAITSANPSTITIVLDTTDGTGLWDAEWFVNGNSWATATDMSLSSPIVGVGVGSYRAGATISSFSLDVSAIPEPSSVLLGSLGLLILLRRRRD